MTHLTPTALLFFAVAVVISYVYFWWHIWYYDRFASIFPTRRQAFKCIITWLLLVTHMLYGTFSVALTYIKYSVGYMSIPRVGSFPTPYSAWPSHYKDITPALYYALAAGLALHISTQIEETCYWVQLARSIRGRTTKSWLSSVWFFVWFIGTIGSIISFLAVSMPFDDDPQQMETNLLLTASVWSLVATMASIYVVVKFPQLIQSVRKQGGSQEVLMRLAYHRQLTNYRIYARITFCIPILVITIDGLTTEKEVAHREYLTDLFICFGLFGLFASGILSILIYFPPMKAFSTADEYETAPILPMSPVKTAAPRRQHNARAMETDEARRREHEQAKSQLSIVAPFATPPPTPRPNRRDYDDDLDAEYDKRDIALGQIRAKRGDDLAGTTISRLSSLSPPNGFGRTESRVTAGSKEDAGNQYAWSMLADHLRLPENAMGLMSMEMNDSNARWQDARRNVEQQFFPGVMTSTQREATGQDEEHQERLQAPRMSADPYGGLGTSPEHQSPMTNTLAGQPPHLGPPVPIIQTEDLTSADVLESHLGHDGLPTGQSNRFPRQYRPDDRSVTPSSDRQSRKLSYKRKPLPASPGSSSARQQPLGMGIKLSIDDGTERTRSLPPPLRSPPKNNPLARADRQ